MGALSGVSFRDVFQECPYPSPPLLPPRRGQGDLQTCLWRSLYSLGAPVSSFLCGVSQSLSAPAQDMEAPLQGSTPHLKDTQMHTHASHRHQTCTYTTYTYGGKRCQMCMWGGYMTEMQDLCGIWICT